MGPRIRRSTNLNTIVDHQTFEMSVDPDSRLNI